MSSELFEKLAARLGPKGYATDSETLAPHLVEWRGKHRGVSPFLALPQSTEEVSDVVRLCAEARVAITPQGGNTGLVAGQIPQGEVLVSLKRMNRIRATDSANDSLVAEAGVILSAVQQAARDSDRMFPLSLASEGSATIGGLISTNAGGVHVLRYGMMRDPRAWRRSGAAGRIAVRRSQSVAKGQHRLRPQAALHRRRRNPGRRHPRRASSSSPVRAATPSPSRRSPHPNARSRCSIG